MAAVHPPPSSSDEPARLQTLRRLNLLDTPPEAAFDDITQLASLLCGVPIATISLVDERRVWFKSKRGIPVAEMPRDTSLCSIVADSGQELLLSDVRTDERFANHPITRGELGIRFYAGIPIVAGNGFVLGTLCVADESPRELSSGELSGLRALGRQAGAQLELRLRAEELSLVSKSLEALQLPEPAEEAQGPRSEADLRWDRSAEKRLRELTALQQAILDSANYAIISCDTSGTIRTFNASASRMSGYAAQEVMGKANITSLHDRIEMLIRAKELSAELNEPVQAGVEVLFARPRIEGADEAEWTYIRKDGSRFPILLSVTALRDGAGATIGYLAVGKDITDHKEVDRMKSEFISTVSHELRTPLTSIRGALGLLEGGVVGPLTAEAQEVVQIAMDNSQRLIRLINELLELDKMEAGKIELCLQNIDPNKLSKAALEGIRGMADQAGVQLALSLEARGIVRGDWDRLIQVLTNLLSNAIKFSPKGGVVQLKVERGSRIGLRFAVKDDGPGIAADQVHKLFRKFQQLDASDARQKGGTGLGLAISKALVEHHGGMIGVDSREGEGSIFWFEVPADEAPESRRARSSSLPPR